MMQLRKSNERGDANHGWLKSHHSFSFADYYDPNFMGYRSLRVINEDYIAGQRGFGMHPHRDMEIITFVVKGALQHEDTMGNKAVILPGEVQKLSAGTGMMHSEMNAGDEEVHLFQIWIQPNKRGLPPTYGQKSFTDALNSKKLVLTVSGDGRDGSIQILQDADMYVSRLKAGDDLEFKLCKSRGAWVQVVAGHIKVNGKDLRAGDAIAAEDTDVIKFEALEQSEFLLFDMA